MEDHLRGLLSDALQSSLEGVVGLALVSDERVDLAVTSKADAFADVFDHLEVLHPEVVDGAEHDVLFSFDHRFAGFGDLSVVGGLGDALDFFDDWLTWLELLEIADGCVIDEREDLVDIFEKDGVVEYSVAVLFDHPCVVADVRDNFVEIGSELGSDVLSEQDFSAEAVDVLTLGVEDVVVLEDVLSGFEEVVLDSLLGLRDHLAEEACGDFFHWRPCLEHGVIHHVRVKDLPEVVFERDEVLGLTGVALTSSAASQLVIDSARLVSLRSEDEEAAKGANLFGLSSALLVAERERRRSALVTTTSVGLVGVAVLVDTVLCGFDLVSRHSDEVVFHASAEEDVDTTTGHVGGDGDGALSSSFGDDERFLLVELRVENVVGDAVLEGLVEELEVGGFNSPLLETPIGPLLAGRVAWQVELAKEHGDFAHVELAEFGFEESSGILRVVSLDLFGYFDHGLQSSGDDQLLEEVGLESGGDQLGHFDGSGSNEGGLLLRVESQDFPCDHAELSFVGLVDDVGLVNTEAWSVGGDGDNVKTVDLAELVFFGLCRTGHTAELLVKSEEVLEGDGCNGLALVLNGNAFLCFECLVEAVAEAATEHHAPGVFIDDHDFSVSDDVVDISGEEAVGFDGCVDVVEEFGIAGDVVDSHQLFNAVHTFFGKAGVVVLLIGGPVLLGFELDNDLVDLVVDGDVLHRRAADDVRGSGFVDQNRVNFVDDGEVELTHAEVFFAERHVVSEVVKSEFVVGSVGDVARVGFPADAGAEVEVARVSEFVAARLIDVAAAELVGLFALTLDDSDTEAEEVVNRTHPDGVASGEVVVDGNEVGTASGECVEDQRRSSNKGLSFTSLHFGDSTLVENETADELDVKVAHA